jgi:sec-independent protein translocase protein TatC
VAVFPLDPDTQRIGRSLLAAAYELRSRLFKALLSLLAIFLVMAPFQNQIFAKIATPIMTRLPLGSSLISKQVAGPFITPLKAVFWLAVFIAMPAMLYHLWKLIDQWLPANARRIALPFMFASVALFYLGVAFAYFLVLPMAFGFFANAAPKGVKVMTDINSFLDFTIGMTLAFGLAFQVPIAIVVSVWTGLVTPATLKKSRPYVFLGVFVVGAVLTPPDVLSQTLLAVPMYLLFEGALLFCGRFTPPKRE